VRRLDRAVTDRTVAFVGPAGTGPQAVIKLAESPSAGRRLEHEAQVLSLLHGDHRLEAFRPLVPRVLAQGEIDSGRFLVESVVPGVTASLLMARARQPAVSLGLLAQPIEMLHRLTRSEVDADAGKLAAWVDDPLSALERNLGRSGRPERWKVRALECLRAELHEELLGRRIATSWIHADYSPGNILVDGDVVTGIVDWELATTEDIPALDLMQLVLSSSMLVRRCDLGQIVIEKLAGRWSDYERPFIDRISAPPYGDLGPRELVLLAWLRHTSGVLTKTVGYAGNRVWNMSNITTVLKVLS
jgi:aminoglycoside phosphotransferase